jgi:malate dehydrogenase (oxaloacetate-decarboxylating)
MKVAAAEAIAAVVADDLRPTAIVPSPLDPRVAPAVAEAVIAAAVRDGVARRQRPASSPVSVAL